MKYILLTIITVLTLNNYLLADFNKIINSTIKITTTINNEPGHCYGTGFIFDSDDDELFIMSAGHVSYNSSNIIGNAYHEGKESISFPIKEEYNTWSKPEENQQPSLNDVSILSCMKKDIINYSLPKPTNIVHKDFHIIDDKVVYMMGCPDGNYPSLIKGRTVTKNINGEFFKFLPQPIAGRSGSGIFTEEGDVCGIVIWRSGVAVPPNKINDAIVKWKENRNGSTKN